MKKIILSIVALSSALVSCVIGENHKGNQEQKDNANETLILSQDTMGLVRVKSSGGYDTLVHKNDVERVQYEHYTRYYDEGGRGSFHSTSYINGKSTHYACTHSSHTSHYSSYNPNRN
jgi:hypothetical protein